MRYPLPVLVRLIAVCLGCQLAWSAAAQGEHKHGEAHSPGAMQGVLGPYPMSREASGTSWQPDSSPHEGIHGSLGAWTTMAHGFANLVVDRQGGPRGDSKTFSTSMLMLMAQRPLGDGTFALRGMVS